MSLGEALLLALGIFAVTLGTFIGTMGLVYLACVEYFREQVRKRADPEDLDKLGRWVWTTKGKKR